jgi:hypothetical protein
LLEAVAEHHLSLPVVLTDLTAISSVPGLAISPAAELASGDRALAFGRAGSMRRSASWLPISRARSEKPDEHGDVLWVVKPTSRRRFVSEPITLTKKDLGFWIGMALWIGPPLFPLLVLIVWAIQDVPWQGRTATIADHAAAEAPAVERASSNGIGPAGERHTNLSVLFGAPAKLGVHSSQP